MRIPVQLDLSAGVRHIELDTKPCFKPHLDASTKSLEAESKNDCTAGHGNTQDDLFARHEER